MLGSLAAAAWVAMPLARVPPESPPFSARTRPRTRGCVVARRSGAWPSSSTKKRAEVEGDRGRSRWRRRSARRRPSPAAVSWLADHRRDPVGFAGEVHIVGPRRRAGGHQRRAVEPGTGQADGGDDHARARRTMASSEAEIGCVGDDQRQAARRANLVTHLGQLVGAAPGHGPFALADRAIGLQQVLGDQSAGVAGGSVDHGVEFAQTPASRRYRGNPSRLPSRRSSAGGGQPRTLRGSSGTARAPPAPVERGSRTGVGPERCVPV